jgi:hypothetical protein
MTAHTLHVHLSRESAARLDGDSNAAGQTLRDWLLDAFERQIEPCLAHASLFSTSIEVAPDVPLLIEAYTRIAACTPEELIEAWLMEPPAADDGAGKRARVAATPSAAPTLSGETLGKIATHFRSRACSCKARGSGITTRRWLNTTEVSARVLTARTPTWRCFAVRSKVSSGRLTGTRQAL